MSFTTLPWEQWKWHARLLYRLTHWGRKPRFITREEFRQMMIDAIYNVDPYRTPMMNVRRKEEPYRWNAPK